jgi:hypothetical protein
MQQRKDFSVLDLFFILFGVSYEEKILGKGQRGGGKEYPNVS